ncbi:MAG: Na+/H+ antiporter NhaA [Actinomycetota bacterium]
MSDKETPTTSSWLASDRAVPRLVARPVREFLDTEVAGGVVLLVAAAIALIWANSPLRDSYETLLTTELSIEVGGYRIAEDLQHWVNDALMALFFFVVGLEVKRELAMGELSDAKKAAFPSIAALGGMIVPALIYVAFNFGGEGSAGWGIPMATDIAFAVGVLALFGNRIHPSLKVFLLSLAVADDIGAIVVIALFYTSDLNLVALAVAGGLLGVVALLRALRVIWIPLYVLVGAAAWLATYESGVHATIAGVALGLMTPVRPSRDPSEDSAESLDPDPDRLEDGEGEGLAPKVVRAWRLRTQERVAVGEYLEHLLHPWTSFVVIPIFALVNAGVSLTGEDVSNALSSPITLGIVAGLVVGKLAGISLFAYAAQRFGFAEVPEGVSGSQIMGAAAIAGIGFTVSLFITELAFDEAALIDEAKVGILAASALAAALGAAVLRFGGRSGGSEDLSQARETMGE